MGLTTYLDNVFKYTVFFGEYSYALYLVYHVFRNHTSIDQSNIYRENLSPQTSLPYIQHITIHKLNFSQHCIQLEQSTVFEILCLHRPVYRVYRKNPLQTSLPYIQKIPLPRPLRALRRLLKITPWALPYTFAQ